MNTEKLKRNVKSMLPLFGLLAFLLFLAATKSAEGRAQGSPRPAGSSAAHPCTHVCCVPQQ
jgi:hypothetical protein